MGLFSMVRGIHPSDPALVGLLTGGNVESVSGMVVTPDSAMREATVYACIRVLSDSVATLPLKVYKKRRDGAGKDEAPYHPLYLTLSKRTSRALSSFEFRKLMMTMLLLRGNAVAKIIPTGGNAVSEMIPLDPDRLEIKRANNGMRAYLYHPGDSDDLYYQQPSNREEVYLQNEVYHLMGQSLNGGLSGLSPITYHRETIGSSMATREFGARLFRNGTHIGTVIETDKPLKEVARENLKKSLENGFATVMNAGKAIILEEGMKIAKLGMTSEDAQYLESRKFSRSEIAGSIFGVPPHKIGDLDRSTNNNIEHQAIEYVTDSLMPYIRLHEDAYLRDCFSESDVKKGFHAEFNLMGALRGDSVARAEYYSKRFQTASITPNQIKELENENPGGEELDKYYIQMNMVPVEMSGKQPEQPVVKEDVKP